MQTALQRMAPALFFGLILGLWETGSRLEWWSAAQMPPPSAAAGAIVRRLQDGTLAAAMAGSLWRLGAAFLAALVGGTLAGAALAASPLLQRTFGTLSIALLALPAICWLPLAVVWFGVNERAVFFVTLAGALLPITVAAMDGIRSAPPVYASAARMMGVRGVNLYLEVLLPAALPALLSGAKQGWAFAWRALMSGELIVASASSAGLGHLLSRGRDARDMSLVLAVMVIVIAIGVLADRLIFARLEQSVRNRWGLTSA